MHLLFFKSRDFNLPYLHLVPHSNFADTFAVNKLESPGYRVGCLRDHMFSRFDTIPACDGQMDGHMTMANTTLAWSRAVKISCVTFIQHGRYTSSTENFLHSHQLF